MDIEPVRLPPPAPPQKPKPSFQALHRGTEHDFRQLADLRGIQYAAHAWADERGLLRFATLKDHLAWIVTDSARLNAQARRMDGQLWDHLEAKPKAWTLPGSRASWPIGIEESEPFETIALCEGGPDFLAAHALCLQEYNSHCAPVGMLGASMRIHADALPLFFGKIVRIFVHNDDAGRKAAENWTDQLEAAGAIVDAFPFAGLRKTDGALIKDLNDFLDIDPNELNPDPAHNDILP